MLIAVIIYTESLLHQNGCLELLFPHPFFVCTNTLKVADFQGNLSILYISLSFKFRNEIYPCIPSSCAELTFSVMWSCRGICVSLNIITFSNDTRCWSGVGTFVTVTSVVADHYHIYTVVFLCWIPLKNNSSPFMDIVTKLSIEDYQNIFQV